LKGLAAIKRKKTDKYFRLNSLIDLNWEAAQFFEDITELPKCENVENLP